MSVELAEDYRPSEAEPFMNERQRRYFRDKLLNWRDEILRESRETLEHLQDENQNHPDLVDRASRRARNLDCRTRSTILRAARMVSC